MFEHSYQPNTNNFLYCNLEKPEVAYYKATILVTNQYGRSLALPNIFFVGPDQSIYNFETYAGKWLQIKKCRYFDFDNF